MKYHQQLGLVREPFSNSPDPNFLYYSRQHIACLQELEIAVRLKRGLNMVIGEIGTGKTTLCRRFVRNLSGSDDIVVKLMLDPHFKTEHGFLRWLCGQFGGELPDKRHSTWALKEQVKQNLFRLGVKEEKTLVLIIDEGQKMTMKCLELLRELLNYETNNSKLLQIVIFAQEELRPVLESMPNFMDRINLYKSLGPLGFRETRAMIEYRLSQAAPAERGAPRLFTWFACRAVHRATGGYPRKVVRLCHKALLLLMLAGRKRVTRGMVRECVREELQLDKPVRPRMAMALVSLLLAFGALAGVQYVDEVRAIFTGIESASATTGPLVVRITDKPEASVLAAREAATGAALDPAAMAKVAKAQPSEVELAEPVLPEDGTLGFVTMMPGESISVMIRQVYGVYDKANLKKVLAANDDIRDVDAIAVGSRIRFPVIEPEERVLPTNLYWITMDSAADLGTAYGLLRKYRFFNLDLRILPAATSAGLAFAVVLEKPFAQIEEAEATLVGLPLTLQKQSGLLVAGDGLLWLAQANELTLKVAGETR